MKVLHVSKYALKHVDVARFSYVTNFIREAAMSTITTNVCVTNNFSFPADITLTHQFSDNTQQSWTWYNVSPGTTSTPTQPAYGNTSAGHDYWTISVNGLDISQQVWSHTSQKTCTLESEDNNTTVTMSVSPNGWLLPLVSGGCSTSLDQTSTTIGAYVSVTNSFGASAYTIGLTHQYSSNPTQSWSWTNIASGETTEPEVAIGSTDAGWDYWTMTVVLVNGQTWTNSGQKRCTLEAADMDANIVMDVSSNGWTLPLPSGGCTTGLSDS